MRIIPFLIGAMFLLLASGCTPAIPDWVHGRSGQFPEDAWLTGVGAGERRSEAEDRARAAIAKVFSVQVQSTQSSSESFWMNRLASAERSGYEQRASSELTSRTDRLLTGVRIAEVWEKQPRELYALAVLDRGQAAHPLRQELAEIDLAIGSDLAQAGQKATAIERLARNLRALQRFERRREVAADLAILVPSGYVVAAPASAAEVAARAESAAAEIRIGLKLEGDEKGVVEGALIAALAKLGLTISNDDRWDLQVAATISLEPYRGDDRWHWVMASVESRFLLPGGRALDSARNTVREGSQVESRSRVLALEKAGDALASAVVQKLFALGSAGLD